MQRVHGVSTGYIAIALCYVVVMLKKTLASKRSGSLKHEKCTSIRHVDHSSVMH
jgi:hypothetical protein